MASVMVAAPVSSEVIDRPYFRAGPVVVVFSGSDFYEEDYTAPIAHDFLLLDDVTPGTAATDLIAGDGVAVNFPFTPVSDGRTAGWAFEINDATFGGEYTNNPSLQVLDENDSYTAFGLDDDTDIDLLGPGNRFAFFFVASNAAFDIHATTNNLVTSGDFTGLDYNNIRYNFFLFTPTSPTIGQRSQNPAVGGAGIVTGNNSRLWTLGDLEGAPRKIFDGGRRTAASEGSLADHAVGFASLYRLRGSPINGNNYDLSMGTGILGADVIYTIYSP